MQAAAVRNRIALALTALAAAGTMGAAPAYPTTVAAADALARVAEQDAPLDSYAVPVRMEVRLHRLLTIHVHFDGMQYFRRPGRVALDIRQIPKQYRDEFADLGTPLTWSVKYDWRVVSTPDGRPQLVGVPKHPGAVESMTLDAGREPGAPMHAVFAMHDGGSIDMHVTQRLVDGYALPAHTDADMVFGPYRIHASIDYGQYSVNGAFADSVFET